MAPGAGIPRAIDVIVMRALSDVDDRYPTAAAMAQALRDALTQPVLPAAVVHVPEAPATAVLTTAIEINQGPPVDLVVMEAGEHSSPELAVVPQRGATRTPVAVGLGVGLVLCLIGLTALWKVGAALDGGPIVADQAMNSAAPSEIEATVLHRPARAPAAPTLLPPVPLELVSTPTVAKTGSTTPRADDPRVSNIRRAINRCNPLVPYSVSTITVKTKPNGKTLILFGAHEARGQLGTCVAQIAARTTIAKGERLSFKL